MTDNSLMSPQYGASSDASAKDKVVNTATNVAATSKDDARQVAGTAKEGAGDVAHEAAQQVRAVGGMAKDHARGLMEQTTSQLRTHGDDQAQRAAGGLDQVANQLRSLLEGRPEEAGQVADYAQQLGDKAQQLAEQLRTRGVDGVVSDVTRFARRRPGVFLAGAAAAGFFAGRLVRAQQASSSSDSGPTSIGGPGTAYGAGLPAGGAAVPAYPTATPVPVVADVPPAPPLAADPASGAVSYGTPATPGPLGRTGQAEGW